MLTAAARLAAGGTIPCIARQRNYQCSWEYTNDMSCIFCTGIARAADVVCIRSGAMVPICTGCFGPVALERDQATTEVPISAATNRIPMIFVVMIFDILIFDMVALVR